MSTASKVRKHKDANPMLYCSVPRCLWRIKHNGLPDTPCRKHTRLPQLTLPLVTPASPVHRDLDEDRDCQDLFSPER